MKTPEQRATVAIIGGGPAGSALGAYLARAGVDCIILEKERFPRPHVGESLVLACNRVLDEIGVLSKIDAAGFPKKFGAAWSTNPKSGAFYEHDWADVAFAERESGGPDREYTYHVDRGRFDFILLRHAEQCGARVLENARVLRSEFSENAGARLEAGANSERLTVHADLVVDASGRDTFLGRRLGFKKNDPDFDRYAVHAWFEGFDRNAVARRSGIADYILIHFIPDSDAWLWQIPISTDVTSFGLVSRKNDFRRFSGDRAAFFYSFLDRRPDLRDALARARQMTAFRAEGDYSYEMSEIAGDGFILIGDAARFVDPIFSSGVSIALSSARFAARDILEKLERAPDRPFRRDDFAGFKNVMRNGMRNWRQFIGLYYRLNVLFTHFIQEPRYRLDVLQLLQGDVYDESPPEVLGRMQAIVEEVQSDPEHIWHPYLRSPGGRTTGIGFTARGRGEIVLLLHGSPASRQAWRAFQEELQDFRTVAVDLMGYGEAPFPANADRHSLDDEADYLEAIIEARFGTEPLHVVGVSYGGAVGLHLAARRPERVRSLALFEPISYYLLPPSPERERFAGLMGDIETTFRQGESYAALRAFFDLCGGEGLYDSLPAYVLEVAAARLPKVMLDYRAALRLPPDTPTRASALEKLRALAVPALVLSTRDTGLLEKRVAGLLAETLPCCEPVEMAGRHSAFVLQADETNAVFADFLRAKTKAP